MTTLTHPVDRPHSAGPEQRTAATSQPDSGFHAGELAAQRRAGVRVQARRLVGMVEDPDLRGGMGRFLAERTFAAITARDDTGQLWISPLVGPHGFLDAVGSTNLQVHAIPAVGDPLHGLQATQQVGLLAIDFAKRRRVRVNGTLTGVGASGMRIEVEQAYGNCPQYIQQRQLRPASEVAAAADVAVRRSDRLSNDDIDLIRRADTLMVGTLHPDRGGDASHRGGAPGFVRVEDSQTLWWPEYPGNNMFNTLGNLTVDPSAALLLIDFESGATVYLSGLARVDWAATGAGDDAGTGRRVVFTVEKVVSGRLLPLRATGVSLYAHNPVLGGAVDVRFRGRTDW